MIVYKYRGFTLELYKTLIWREWRWRLKAGNNKIIAASTESYKNKVDCIYNINLISDALPGLLEFIKNDK